MRCAGCLGTTLFWQRRRGSRAEPRCHATPSCDSTAQTCGAEAHWSGPPNKLERATQPFSAHAHMEQRARVKARPSAPVFCPISSVSCTKSRRCVPIWVRLLRHISKRAAAVGAAAHAAAHAAAGSAGASTREHWACGRDSSSSRGSTNSSNAAAAAGVRAWRQAWLTSRRGGPAAGDEGAARQSPAPGRGTGCR